MVKLFIYIFYVFGGDSVSFKKWVVGSPDREFAKLASEELDIDPFTALIAGARGINDITELEYFLTNEPVLSDINTLVDINKAADAINEAIESKLKIAIFGDYDCDGVMATAIMYKYLVSRGADVITYIPDRISEGYGMNIKAIDSLKESGAEFIITVDNGISSNEEIAYAANLGIITVVTDHHIPAEVLPDAAAVVDPHRTDDFSEFKDICGAQVAFKVICAVENKEPEELLNEYADLLTVAIIGDFMPMINENRSIVKTGINLIKQNHNVGLSAILSVAGIDKNFLDSSKISFGIAPRLNAAGRMGSAKRALDIVLCNNISSAISLANEIESENSLRQKEEKTIFENIISTIEKNGYNFDRVIVADGLNLHLGVIGIVAARICEKYGKPALVLSTDGAMAHGSGRSFSGFNLFDAIKNSSRYLEKFGGHELAAGISLKQENIDNFRKAINDYAFNISYATPTLDLDFKINPSALSVDMVYASKSLEPFGNQNKTPLYGIFGVELKKIASIGGGKHLKLLFSKNNVTFEAVLFGTTLDAFCFDVGNVLDIAVALDINNYRNETYLSVIIRAIRPNGIDEDKLFNDLYETDRYFSNHGIVKKVLLPSRDDVGQIYRYITVLNPSKNKIIYHFLSDIGYAKTVISLTVLSELNLIEFKGNKYICISKEKTDLNNSHTYKIINEAGE